MNGRVSSIFDARKMDAIDASLIRGGVFFLFLLPQKNEPRDESALSYVFFSTRRAIDSRGNRARSFVTSTPL